ncbi:MAG: SBBP repeat-containing protein, partial [Pirellulaceae bacterium]
MLSASNQLLGIPDLNSNPGAATTLYLDFDGHFEAIWGSQTNVTTPVYDIDGDPSGMNVDEVSNIQEAWVRVAEDFAPFDINVTTEEPPELADGVPESAANGVALRIAIGGTGGGGGGVGIIDSFTNSNPNVAFVYLGTFNIGNTSSHEAGHSFGLQHQSVYDSNEELVEAYNGGDRFWSPVMGSSGAATISTWHNGPSILGSSVFQDDIAVLGNSLGFRADDHGNTAGTATPLAGDGTTYSGAGLIGANGDLDVFSFTLSTNQTIRMTVDAAQIGPNLDATIELRDAGGNLIAESSPEVELGAEVVSSLTAGDYFLHVTNVAEYGRIGQYTISGSQISPGARIIATTPDEFAFGESLSSLRVVFSDPIDIGSFTAGDITLTGPTGGTIAVAGVTVVPNTNDRQFDVTFAAQTDFGTYTVQIGPQVLNLVGNAMNQDADLVSGETSDDVFSAEIEFAGLAPGFAIGIGGAGYDRLWGMTGDADGNTYITGMFSNTAAFNGINLTSQGETDGFIAKVNSDGDTIWARRFGGTGDDRGYTIDVDAAGNVYIAGAFTGTADFGGVNLTSTGGVDSLVAKIDQAGNFVWTRAVGGSEDDGANPRVRVDELGNVFIRTGRRTAGINNPLVAKFDGDGNFLWEREGAPQSGTGLATDADGNVYVGGSFNGTEGRQITKLDASGTVIWATAVDAATAIVADNAGNVFAIGTDIVNLDAATGDLLWAHTFGAAGRGISVDNQGDVYVSGNFSGEATYRGTTLTSAGGSDAFVLKLNSSGDLLSSFALGGASGDEIARDAVVDAAGNLYVASELIGSQAEFPAGTVTGAGDYDGFVPKLQLAP